MNKQLWTSWSVLFLGLSACGTADPAEPAAQIVVDPIVLEQGAALQEHSAAHPHAEVDHRAFSQQGCDHEEKDDVHTRGVAHKRVSWRARHRHPKGSVDVKVLGFNDFHGQLSTGRLVAGRPVGGAAVLASYLQDAAADFQDRSLIIHAGDHVGASPPASALLQDEPTMSFLNLLGNRHCSRKWQDNPRCNVVGTLGNHEFDEGKAELLRLIYGGKHASGPFLDPHYRGTTFPYVSANVLKQNGQTLLPAYVIKQLGGVAVGVIGAVLKETPSIVTPSGVAGLTFVDEAKAINQAVSKLRAQGVRSIIVSIHQGGSQTSFSGPTPAEGAVSGIISDIVMQLDDEVDVVISGHAHAFTNALIENINGAPILVTQAFSSSTAFADIDLKIDRRSGDVAEKSAQIITTYADQSPGNAPVAAVAELVAQAEAKTAPLVNQVLAEAAGALTRTQNAAGESALGNLIADAQRAALGTDFAFMNPGGVRADLDAGSVTWGELFTVQPFGNSLVRLSLTGAQVVQLLNQQWSGQPFARITSVSGLTYSWDNTRPAHDRVVDVRRDGAPLDLSARYTVAVNSFMAAGGDNFTVLVSGTERVGGPVDLDALIEYVTGLAQPFSASVEGRITRLDQ